MVVTLKSIYPLNMEKYKLLIVEDDPNLGQILREYLELKGYDTVLCTDGDAWIQDL